MNLHEYQAKELLKKFGVRVQEGIVATTPEEAVEAAKKVQEQTGTQLWVLKAQIHAGGRGKAGGVKVAKTLDEVYEIAKELIGKILVTPQTGPEGKKVRKILVAQDVYYSGPEERHEYYLSMLVDREKETVAVIYSPEGGVDIEEVAEKSPEKIFTEHAHPTIGLLPFQARKIAFNLGLKGQAFKDMVNMLQGLYKAFTTLDASLIEINPLLKASDGRLIAVDAKVQIDDNALFRHPDIAEMRDIEEEDPAEVIASKHGLSFVKLDGFVGCMVNGAGLAMATMDLIKYHGGEPANFLDVGGKATPETVKVGFELILRDPNVKSILVNIFGGIVRGDRVAKGIVQAVEEMGGVPVPVVVRLQGTNADLAREIIEQSGLNVHYTTGFDEAAKLAVELAKQQN